MNTMKIDGLELEGVYLIENYNFEDERGEFIKCFSDELYRARGINFAVKEVYYSLSRRDVIRGMHFQLPPFDHSKLIFVVEGEILDVVLDLRRKSSTFKKHVAVELKSGKNSIYIPPGCAHGFKSMADNATVVYNQSSCYSPESDAGILWNSFGFEWNVASPIMSRRDRSFPKLIDFDSPF